MSKVLPATITDRKGGDWERILLIYLAFRDEDDPAGNPVWQAFNWATREITINWWNNNRFLNWGFKGGVLLEKGFSELSESVDVENGGNVAQLSGFSFKIANPQYSGELRFDEVIARKRPENGWCELWLALVPSGQKEEYYGNLLLLKKGTIKDMKYDYGTYTIEIEDAWKKRHKDLLTMINRENYPSVSESALGKIMPLLYGYDLGSLGAGTWDSYSGVEYGFPLILIDEVENKYLVSQNNLVEFKTYYTYHGVPGGALGQVAIFDSETLTMVYLISGTLGTLPGTGWTLTSGRPTTVALPKTEIWGCCEKQFTTRGSQSDLPGNFDVENAIDPDQTTFISLTAGMKAYFQARFPENIFEIIQRTRIKLVVQFYNPTSIPGTGKIKYYNPSFNGVAKFSDGKAILIGEDDIEYDLQNTGWPDGDPEDLSAHGTGPGSGYNEQDSDWIVDQLNTYEFGVECESGTLQIANIFLQILWGAIKTKAIFRTNPGEKATRRRGLPSPGFSSSGSGGMEILTPSVNESIGSVVCNPLGEHWDELDRFDMNHSPMNGAVSIIESVLRRELGLSVDDINLDSFDKVIDPNSQGGAYGMRGNIWEASGAIIEQVNSLDWIGKMVHQFALIYFCNYQNKETLKVLGNEYGNGLPIVKTINSSTIEERGIKIRLSSLDSVYNEFEISTEKNYCTGTYGRTYYLTANSDTAGADGRDGIPDTYRGLCAQSQTQYGLVRKLNLEMEWVWTNFDWMMSWLAEWFCNRKYIADIEFAGLDHLELELGDHVLLDLDLLPTGIRNSARFMVISIEHLLNDNKLKMKFIQIPDLLP